LLALSLLGALSVCLMHDWLSGNAARWDLGRRAAAQGIEPDQIQGGFEWGNRYPSHSSWQYRLSLSPPADCVVVDSESYTRWLPPQRGRVYLLRLQGATPSGKPR
jgi:hypothetical protein